ncbi:hypothetical protein [Mesorhizobium sp. M0091]|uniref:hypothetical protein n=1 Tax=Mesorhizobium sp. M0091 TaxID=2956875 RepID=UPI00333748C6
MTAAEQAGIGVHEIAGEVASVFELLLEMMRRRAGGRPAPANQPKSLTQTAGRDAAFIRWIFTGPASLLLDRWSPETGEGQHVAARPPPAAQLNLAIDEDAHHHLRAGDFRSRWQQLEQLVQLPRFHGRNVAGDGFDAIAQVRQ